MKKIIVVIICFIALSVQAEMVVKNKGTPNNCNIKVLKTVVSKEWNIRKGRHERVRGSTRRVPLYEINHLDELGFNPTSITDSKYSPKEGDIFIASAIDCRDIGSYVDLWMCYSVSTMYLHTNGLSLVIASAKDSDGVPWGVIEVGISKLAVRCE